MKQNLLLLFISIFVLSTSCNTQKTKKSEDKKDDGIVEEALIIQTKGNTIADTKAMFEMSDVSYYSDIINKPTNAIDYTGSKRIAANIGVYLADMLYAMSTSGDRKDTYPIYGAVMELAKNVGLTDEFPNLIIDRYIDDNLSPDSALIMLQNALDSSKKKLSDNDKSVFFSYLIFGNYIEKLYIISSLIEKPNNNDLPNEVNLMMKRNLLLLMGDQKEPLDKLLLMLSNHIEGSIDESIFNDVKVLSELYKGVKENNDALMQLKPAELYQAKEIVAIFRQIEKLRNIIIIE